MGLGRPAQARAAFDALAPYYDSYTAHADYARKLAAVAALLGAHAAPGRRLLDVACGTGNSLLALLRRGWDARGCDVSEAMVQRARAKLEEPGRAVVADMRELPPLGPVDVVTCLGDSINSLLDEGELDAAVSSMAAQLVPGGLLVFDLSTLLLYRTWYAQDSERRTDGTTFRWHGSGAADAAPGSLHEATIEVIDRQARQVSTQRQRHWPWSAVAAALERASLEPLAVHGQREDATLAEPADEAVHHKLLVVCRKRDHLCAARSRTIC